MLQTVLQYGAIVLDALNINPSTTVMSGLFVASEVLSLIPAVKSNGVFQLLFGWIRRKQPAAPVKPD